MKTVLITGAASGIGLAIARRFARAGWFVGLFDINEDACASLASSADFPHAVAGFCDVTRRDSVQQALDTFAAASDGALHVLVNNAGVLSAGALCDLTAEQVDAMIDVNVRGLTQVTQLAFPLLRATPDAVLINLCSASSIHGIPLLSVYSASKFYVDGLTQALRIEWAEHDIHVTSLKPPPINTSMGRALDPKHTERTPVSMEPEDVAEAAFAAVSRRYPHHILGANTKVWHALDRILPAPLGERLTRFLMAM
jgi:NAD(P)-dependent dehydrogenase (short-subunit alcohol dehydrogenase family)